MSNFGDGLHVKPLTRVVLNSAKEHQRDGATLFLDNVNDLLGGEIILPGRRRHLNNSLVGVVPMQLDLRFNGKLKKLLNTKV